MKILLLSIMILFIINGCQKSNVVRQGGRNQMVKEDTTTRVATLAGGCFWCVEADLEKLPGVVKVISGYTGGHKENPTYEEVSSG